MLRHRRTKQHRILVSNNLSDRIPSYRCRLHTLCAHAQGVRTTLSDSLGVWIRRELVNLAYGEYIATKSVNLQATSPEIAVLKNVRVERYVYAAAEFR